MSDPTLVVGVDGGGTKTEALLSIDGKIAGRGGAGSSNYQKVGFAEASHAIEIAVGRYRKAARGSARSRLDPWYRAMLPKDRATNTRPDAARPH